MATDALLTPARATKGVWVARDKNGTPCEVRVIDMTDDHLWRWVQYFRRKFRERGFTGSTADVDARIQQSIVTAPAIYAEAATRGVLHLAADTLPPPPPLPNPQRVTLWMEAIATSHPDVWVHLSHAEVEFNPLLTRIEVRFRVWEAAHAPATRLVLVELQKMAEAIWGKWLPVVVKVDTPKGKKQLAAVHAAAEAAVMAKLTVPETAAPGVRRIVLGDDD